MTTPRRISPFKDDDLDNAYELLELEDDAGEKEIKALL